MKIIVKKSLLLLLSILLFATCTDDNETPDDVDVVGEMFAEGQIDIEVTMKGSPFLSILTEMYRQIDPDRDMDEQMEEFMSNLSAEEMAAFMEFGQAFEDNGDSFGQLGYMMSIMFLPLLDNVVYVKQNDALAKFEALMYRGENKVDYNSQSGQYYLQSRWDEENQISFTYREDDFSEGFAQQPIDSNKYNVQQTSETEIISGHLCQKQIYTAKEQNVAPYKLEVWTSQMMPKSVNFLHPYYMEESGGIMKITAYILRNESFPIEYKFVNVIPRAVSDSEMQIKEIDPIYNFSDDPMSISFQIFAILFGGFEDED